MSVVTSLKALPLHRILALAGAALLLISLFLPWMSLSFGEELSALGVTSDESVNGWNGIGRLAGALAVLLIGWELSQALGIKRVKVSETLATVLALATAVFAFAHFIRALADRESALGFTRGPDYGAFLILVSSAILVTAVALRIGAAVSWRPSPWSSRTTGPDEPRARPGTDPSHRLGDARLRTDTTHPPPPPPPHGNTDPSTSQSDPGL